MQKYSNQCSQNGIGSLELILLRFLFTTNAFPWIHSVWNHQQLDSFKVFKLTVFNKISKHPIIRPLWGEPTSQWRVCDEESVSTPWRHHATEWNGCWSPARHSTNLTRSLPIWDRTTPSLVTPLHNTCGFPGEILLNVMHCYTNIYFGRKYLSNCLTQFLSLSKDGS